MRAALRIIFSRYGIVVIILLLVVGALALARGQDDFPVGSGGSGEETSSSEDSPTQELTADDGVTVPECEGEACHEDDSPLHDPYEEVELPEEAVDKAVGFAEAWVDTEGKGPEGWFQGIQPYMTEEAAALMRGVDPVSVPATEITGEAEVDGDEVRVPMDTGTLVLPMVERSNAWVEQGWLVAAIDWEPA